MRRVYYATLNLLFADLLFYEYRRRFWTMKIKKGRRELTYVIQGWWKLDYRLYGDVVDSLRSSATGTGEIRL